MQCYFSLQMFLTSSIEPYLNRACLLSLGFSKFRSGFRFCHGGLFGSFASLVGKHHLLEIRANLSVLKSHRVQFSKCLRLIVAHIDCFLELHGLVCPHGIAEHPEMCMLLHKLDEVSLQLVTCRVQLIDQTLSGSFLGPKSHCHHELLCLHCRELRTEHRRPCFRQVEA